MRAAAAALLLAAVLLATGCESSQSRSARLAAEAAKLASSDTTIELGEPSEVVEVRDKAVLHDANGAAAVALLRNTGERAIAGVPVRIEVEDTAGDIVFANDAAGSEPSLISAAVIAGGEELFWVNDQVVASGEPAKVKVTVGREERRAQEPLPEIHLSRPRLERDAVSGTAAVGRVRNRSALEQRQLVIYAVARRGDRIVAAGRGQIPKLKPGKSAPYTVFFIGDATDAELTVAAPPTVLDAGS